MALAIAAHEEVLKNNPNRNEGAEYLIDAARLVTLAVLKLVSVVENDEGNEAIGAAATCLKVTSLLINYLFLLHLRFNSQFPSFIHSTLTHSFLECSSQVNYGIQN